MHVCLLSEALANPVALLSDSDVIGGKVEATFVGMLDNIGVDVNTLALPYCGSDEQRNIPLFVGGKALVPPTINHFGVIATK
jgi:hypothetical protein